MICAKTHPLYNINYDTFSMHIDYDTYSIYVNYNTLLIIYARKL